MVCGLRKEVEWKGVKEGVGGGEKKEDKKCVTWICGGGVFILCLNLLDF